VALWMLVAAWGAICWHLLRRTGRDPGAAAWRPTALGVFGGGLAFLVYSLTDTIVLWDKAALAFWALLALTVGLWHHVRGLGSAPGPMSPALAPGPRARVSEGTTGTRVADGQPGPAPAAVTPAPPA
jgi:hypothetical protein